jgi:hypothetical protein
VLRPSSSLRREGRRLTAGRKLGGAVVTTAIAAVAFVATSVVPLVTAAASTSPSFTLASQSPWIGAPGKFSIAMNVTSDLPPSELGLELTLYSKLPNRDAFAETTANAYLPTQSCLDATPLLPVGTSLEGPTKRAVPVTINFKTSTVAPSCAGATTTFSLECQSGQCDGVYPLSAVLVDRSSDQPIASFTTHVIVASARKGAIPLRVGLVSQLGGEPSIAPDGSPALNRSISALSAEVHALATPRGRLSVTLSPDLLLALARSRSSKSLLSAIDALVAHGRPGGHVELLAAAFTNIDASALAANGLGRDVAAAISAGHDEHVAHFGHAVAAAPYVSTTVVGTRGLDALEGACLNEFVVPESSVPALAGASLTQTAPLIVGSAFKCGSRLQPPVAFVSDPTLNAELSAQSLDPVLAGENVLGDLAQIYFDAPFDTDPRAVVAVANEFAEPRLVEVVLNGLRNNPILSMYQLSKLFATVPPGSNGNLATAALVAGSTNDAPNAGAVAASRAIVRAVKATMPNNRSLISSLNHAVFTAEAAGLSNVSRLAYLDAPHQALAAIGRAISITGSGEVTLTARSGKIPITIRTSLSGPGPVHIVFRLASSQLVLPSPATRPVELTSKDTEETVTVQTRTSGSSDLDVVVYSAIGRIALSRRTVIVRSTAVSGVAIALSAAALIVLVGWWVRSTVRTRRKKSAARTIEA